MVKLHYFFKQKIHTVYLLLIFSILHVSIIEASVFRMLVAFIAGHITCTYQVKELIKTRSDDLKNKDVGELVYFIVTESNVVSDLKKSQLAASVKAFIREQLKKQE